MENLVAQKLEALENLQKIDSKLDEIKKIRGDLPQEVQDLEDEIIGYQTRIDKLNADIDQNKKAVEDKRKATKECQALIARYEDQQMNVRNNREYDAFSKEIETQHLDIKLNNKKIEEIFKLIEDKDSRILETNARMEEKKRDLEAKKEELEIIISETEVEEKKLNKYRDKARKTVEDRLYKSYIRIRENSRNGLAVVVVKRTACGGCFNMVPPQRQAEIREHKKIIVCEHCGRIMTSVEEEIVAEKPKRMNKKKKATAK